MTAPQESMAVLTIRCPQCKKETVHRVPVLSFAEQLMNLLGISPFRCQSCSHRFLAFRPGRQYPPVVERRIHPRIPVRLSLAFSGGRIKGEGTVVNISLGGCQVESDASAKTDDIFYLKLFTSEQEQPIEVAAMVRSVSNQRIGMKFLRSAREDRRLIAYLYSLGIE